MTPLPTAASASRLLPAMIETDSYKAMQVVDEFIAGLGGEGLSDDDRAMAYEAALKHLMGHLIRRERWLAEEFTGIARSLGAY